MTKLRANQICPLHRSKLCCGRSHEAPKREKYYYAHGVKRIPDASSPSGFREKCSPSQLNERKDKLIAKGERCGACGKKFTDYREVDLGHKRSKGLGGGTHDDSMPNLFLIHHAENLEQGSMPLDRYLEWRRERGLATPEDL